ncbi:MAG TPA: hypothetical protein PK867_02105, partial [Pirellulales bacterium]|nr:hypothetical protein [Pirellulales bacterium]
MFHSELGYVLTLQSLGEVLERLPAAGAAPALVSQLDAAAASPSPNGSALISTDPPYHGNIGYADLSDFFYIWLRRCLKSYYPSLFATALTPKAQELIATPHRHDGDRG